MNSNHWDKLAKSFEDDITSSLHDDKSKTLNKTLKKYISKKDVIADYGCGVGGFVPFLSSLGKFVSASDFSPKCIEVAKKKHGNVPNAEFFVHDLTKPLSKKCDVAVAANVLISHQPDLLRKMIATISSTIKKGGYFVAVVPSMESILFVHSRLGELRVEAGESPAKSRKHIAKQLKKDVVSLADGVVKVGKVPTKHYIGEEFETLLASNGLEVVERTKAQYSWDTEMDHVPKNLKGPYPWDWIFVAKKK
ncbi:MAG TPA: class I SAM-dependent methyltransferase [Bacteroidia bacterium]|jgi:2-polyprenyl-3-methyl-5-hydroxy-6-metoxy-1,4-benzoquinol methylase|nr:class I SAM-dependent methyltransferase [Bacteroidia bacterium]